jgi:hypothetical protein
MSFLLKDFEISLQPSHDDYIEMPNEFIQMSTLEKEKGIKYNEDLGYKINNYCHRSDDFNSNNKRLLFSGCSTTFGEGLYEDKIWSKSLFNKLNNDNIYQNLSFTGGSTQKIIRNIFIYCKMFGNPEAIFILFPNFERYELVKPSRKFFIQKGEDENDKIKSEIATATYISSIIMLESFCKINNINLVWSTWNHTVINMIKERNVKFENFLLTSRGGDRENFEKKLFELSKIFPKNKYNMLARDLDHPGILEHEIYAEEFYKEYRKKYL